MEGGRCSNKDEGCNLELRLGPPGDQEYWGASGEREDSLLSLGCFSNITHFSSSGAKRGGFTEQQQQGNGSFSFSGMGKESSQPCSSRVVELQNTAEKKKGFSPAAANTAVPNSSQKRTAPAPVVGWPPIRSFRKNHASSSCSSIQTPDSLQNVVPSKVPGEKLAVESCRKKGYFVKINMDGVPIGRKVDLEANDSYEKLCSAVDELFRSLLAAQRDSSEKPITGLLDGSGEYTLVYEDNEGDRILVGDVPWNMFVSTVKRLRVLKSSELSTLCLGSKERKDPTL